MNRKKLLFLCLLTFVLVNLSKYCKDFHWIGASWLILADEREADDVEGGENYPSSDVRRETGNQRDTQANEQDQLQQQQHHQQQQLLKLPASQANNFSCSKLFAGDLPEMQRVIRHTTSVQHVNNDLTSSRYYVTATQDCDAFRHDRSYISQPISEEEAQFPVAFSIVMYKDIERAERLLRAIYRPQNYYCLHVDGKTSEDTRAGMAGIASCFDNVFLSSTSVKVRWGKFSVVEPELVCMKDLWKYSWRYFINLTGQEFPLKTNAELVSILKALNGSNNLEGLFNKLNRRIPPETLKSLAALNISAVKGSVHIVVQRGFVDYVLHSNTSIQLQNILQDTRVPDESYFASLNYNVHLGVPGAYTNHVETGKVDARTGRTNAFITRYKNWGYRMKGKVDLECRGKRFRAICIFGIGDLPRLANRTELFANKFHSTFQPEAYDCLEELHYAKIQRQLEHGNTFDNSYYKQIDSVINHVI